jgi:hypothetical protein
MIQHPLAHLDFEPDLSGYLESKISRGTLQFRPGSFLCSLCCAMIANSFVDVGLSDDGLAFNLPVEMWEEVVVSSLRCPLFLRLATPTVATFRVRCWSDAARRREVSGRGGRIAMVRSMDDDDGEGTGRRRLPASPATELRVETTTRW